MSEVVCTQDWPAYNTAQMQEKERFLELLADLCSEIPEPEYKFGRPKNSLQDMVYCAVFKVYSMYSGRRFTSDMKFAQEKGYIKKAPHYNSVFNYFQREDLSEILNNLIVKSSLPLAAVETDFAVDSSGFSTRVFDRWFDHKWTKNNKHKQWVKAHIMCGVKTNIVTSVRLTDCTGGDSPRFKPLMKDTLENFCVLEVSADKAYSSRENLGFAAKNGSVPYIPFKKNTTGRAGGSLTWSRMYHEFMANQEEFYDHYHKRSNVETTFYMIKSKFGGSVKSKTKKTQFNEVLCKILCHNICVIIQEMEEFSNVKSDIFHLNLLN